MNNFQCCLLVGSLLSASFKAFPAEATNDPVHERLKSIEESLGFIESKLAKGLNALMWFHQLQDVAVIDRIRYTGPPLGNTNAPHPHGVSNEVIITAHTFLPRKFLSRRKLPLLVFVHGEIHGNVVTDEEVHIVRELLEQGYAVIAPDYRGSSGYGGDFWRQIDYGGLEVEDVFRGKQWMLEHHRNIDPERVGILGWSHGGLITLMNIFDHPHDYRVAYAGVPVADLIARIRYRGTNYGELFSAPYHIGKSIDQDMTEYRRRSPLWNVSKLQTPLLIHGNTNDEDVRLEEVEGLIKALKDADKSFEYKIYTNAPGDHHFNRIDTTLAKQSRQEIYRFLAKHLKPPRPPR
jgi:dipeptidyl aminopeptidase/acylaminoacyl peptidase